MTLDQRLALIRKLLRLKELAVQRRDRVAEYAIGNRLAAESRPLEDGTYAERRTEPTR